MLICLMIFCRNIFSYLILPNDRLSKAQPGPGPIHA